MDNDEVRDYIKEREKPPFVKDFPLTTDDPNKTKGLGSKYDSGKLLFECFMGDLAPVIKGVVRVLTYGAVKYKRASWQSVPNAKQRYLDAFYRHMNEYHSGSHIDDESKLPHLYHAVCNLMFITWFEIKENNYIFTTEIK
jgi:hypothetical protein